MNWKNFWNYFFWLKNAGTSIYEIRAFKVFLKRVFARFLVLAEKGPFFDLFLSNNQEVISFQLSYIYKHRSVIIA